MVDRRARFREQNPRSLERGTSSPAFFGDKASSAPSQPNCDSSNGHEFERKTFLKPTFCHYCTEILWGLKSQGLCCKVCGFVVHDRCTFQKPIPCRHIVNQRNVNPVAHQWSQMKAVKVKAKKVFCNTCRKKLSSTSGGVFCEVCKVYVHDICKGSSINDCKDCATYGRQTKNSHHWIEGNLPSGSRCKKCGKSCATSDCLSGFRCGWCGLAYHTSCFSPAMSEPCTSRDLRDMILFPYAVCYPRHVPLQLDHNPANDGSITPMSEGGGLSLVSPVVSESRALGHTVMEEEAIDHTHEEEEPATLSERQCVVMDSREGTGSSRRSCGRTVHPLLVTKEMTAPAVLALALKMYGIASDPKNFCLVEILENEERELVNENVFSLQEGRDCIKLYIRQKKMNQGSLKVYNECSGVDPGRVPEPVEVSVRSASTTVAELLEHILKAFGITGYNLADYCLVEQSQFLSSEVEERVMNENDCPLQQLENLKEESVLASQLLRYVLRYRRNLPMTLYLWGLDKESLRHEADYTRCVKEKIEQTSPGLLTEGLLTMVKIGPAFPTHGGVFVEFPTMDIACKVYTALRESRAKVTLLPSIYPDQLNEEQEVLLVFINEKSGGNQGRSLLSGFRRHLNPHQVFNLAEGGPLPGLFAFRKVKRFSVLIGGGDGTFGWVLSCITDIQPHLTCDNPPCALLPLGTGNDLARALKWGPGYSGEKVMDLLNGLQGAETVDFDRWEVSFFDQSGTVYRTAVMNNYFGVGLDAAIALDFHIAREENPDKFNSRFKNKSVFLQLGLQKMVKKTVVSNITPHITVQADDEPLSLPDLEGLVFLNIQSWGGGSDPWGNPHDPSFRPASYSDGLLEMVGFSGVMRMGQILSGIQGGQRLKQIHLAVIAVSAEVPVQVDGEAWLVQPGKIVINKLPVQARMRRRHRSKDKAPPQPTRHLSEPNLPIKPMETAAERSPLLGRDAEKGVALLSSSPQDRIDEETPPSTLLTPPEKTDKKETDDIETAAERSPLLGRDAEKGVALLSSSPQDPIDKETPPSTLLTPSEKTDKKETDEKGLRPSSPDGDSSSSCLL